MTGLNCEKIAFFSLLCPSLADWSRQASIKPKKNYESKHTDVPSWSGSSAVLQLQSARRYDDRAADRACLRQITAHPQDTEPSHAFSESWEPRRRCQNIPATGRTRAFAGHVQRCSDCSVLMADMFNDGRSGEGPLAPQQDKWGDMIAAVKRCW